MTTAMSALSGSLLSKIAIVPQRTVAIGYLIRMRGKPRRLGRGGRQPLLLPDYEGYNPCGCD